MPKKGVGKNAKPSTVKRGGKSITMGDSKISHGSKGLGVSKRYSQADNNSSVQPQSSRKK